MLQGLGDAVPMLSDELLVTRARDGARSAFVTLVTRYQDRVYRLALRMSRNVADAEEVTQETFLQAHRAIGSFHGESRFTTWLYRITVNQVLMRRRSSKRRPVQSLEGSSDPAGEVLADRELQGADELIDRKMLAQRVRQALAQLDEPQRAALVLRDLEGLSSEDAADILGVSPETVRQRAHRARLKMREQLAGLLATPTAMRS